jgi:hypothetical protein
VPHHFIRRGWANWDDPEAMVGSLVAQIEARVADAHEPEADARLAPAARLAAARLAAALLRVALYRAAAPPSRCNEAIAMHRAANVPDARSESADRRRPPDGSQRSTSLPFTGSRELAACARVVSLALLDKVTTR